MMPGATVAVGEKAAAGVAELLAMDVTVGDFPTS
jgi:hypothetical protein